MASICLLSGQTTESVLFARMLCLSLQGRFHSVFSHTVTASHPLPTVPFDLLIAEWETLPPDRLPKEVQHIPCLWYAECDTAIDDAVSVPILRRPFAMQSLFEQVEDALGALLQSSPPPTDADAAGEERFDASTSYPIYEAEDGIYFASQRLSLSKTEYQLLSYLLKKRGQVCSREQILRDIWGDDGSIQTNLVDVYIRYLRKKIDFAFDVRAIRSVRGQGYLLK